MKIASAVKTASTLAVLGIMLVVSLFVGLMIATAGGALYPSINKISAPITCAGEFHIESSRYSGRPGETGTVHRIFCRNRLTGARSDITLYAIFISFLIYSAIIFTFALVLVFPFIWFAARKAGRAAEGITPFAQKAWVHGFGAAASPRASTSHTRIVFNGREYKSSDEMPAEARAAYEQAMSVFQDNDRNGVPDIFEGGGTQNVTASSFVFPKPPAPQESADPAERLRKLKQLLDAGLINAEEHDAKKAEILSEM